MRILGIERLGGGARRNEPDQHQHGKNHEGDYQNLARLLGDKDENHDHRADVDHELGQACRQEVAQRVHA